MYFQTLILFCRVKNRWLIKVGRPSLNCLQSCCPRFESLAQRFIFPQIIKLTVILQLLLECNNNENKAKGRDGQCARLIL